MELADFPLIFPETDDTARIARAIAALPNPNGGKLRLGPGVLNATSIDFHGRRSIILEGEGSPATGSGVGTNLLMTTGGGQARAIDARDTVSCAITGVGIQYTNAAFTGKVLDVSGGGGASVPSRFLFDRSSIHSGGAGVNGASALISLSGGHSHTIRDSAFGRGVRSIKGRDSTAGTDFSNRITITGCDFNDSTRPPIQNAGQVWSITDCVFEPLADGSAGAYTSNPLTMDQSYQLLVENCWCGDSAASGTWFLYTGVGLTFKNNGVFTGAVAVRVTQQTRAVDMTGNHFGSVTVLEVEPNCRGIKNEPNTYWASVTQKLVMVTVGGITDKPGDAVGSSRARISRVAALSHTNGGGAWQKLPLDTVMADNDGMFDAANGRLVCKTAGVYVVTGQLGFTFNAVGSRYARILWNGVERAQAMAAKNPTDVTILNLGTGPVDMAVNDHLELWAYQDSGGNLPYFLTGVNGGPMNWLSAVRVGA
ncbi:MAG: hypothetical protein M3340_15440 [Actinomycetota bacterium]|nr:hypothetical protein [Actinomycetota bacterium]